VARRSDEADRAADVLLIPTRRRDRSCSTRSTGLGTQTILTATRAALGDAWTPGPPVSGLRGTNASSPQLTRHGRVLVYTAVEGGLQRLFYATRETELDAFGPSAELVLSTQAFDQIEPAIRDDGCELFWVVDRLADGRFEIYSIQIDP
jgi:hypothetical protein